MLLKVRANHFARTLFIIINQSIAYAILHYELL